MRAGNGTFGSTQSQTQAGDNVRVKLDTGMEKEDAGCNTRDVCLVKENRTFCCDSTACETAR